VVPINVGTVKRSSEAVDAYSIFHLAGDIVGLINGLQERSAVSSPRLGAPWHGTRRSCARTVPRGGLLSVPFIARGPMRPSAIVKAVFGDKIFYQEYFQEEGTPSAS